MRKYTEKQGWLLLLAVPFQQQSLVVEEDCGQGQKQGQGQGVGGGQGGECIPAARKG
jgi:hypothetical protein